MLCKLHKSELVIYCLTNSAVAFIEPQSEQGPKYVSCVSTSALKETGMVVVTIKAHFTALILSLQLLHLFMIRNSQSCAHVTL